MGELQIKGAALAVPPCQGGCREFESRLPLQNSRHNEGPADQPCWAFIIMIAGARFSED